VKHNEVNALWKVWASATADDFTFEVGYPRIGTQLRLFNWQRKTVYCPEGNVGWQRWEAQVPSDFDITVPVVMKLKPGAQHSYGARFYRA